MDTKIYNVLVIIFPLLIILGSSIPGASMPELYLFRSDKFLHVLEYLILGHLLMNSVVNKTHSPIFLSLFLGLLFALVDELYQSTVFGRFPSSFDVFADAIGLTLSIIINQKISKIVDG